MKWDKTQQWIDTSTELTMLCIKYRGHLSYRENGKEKQIIYGRPKSLDENDVRSAYTQSMNINIDGILDEIEEKLTADKNHNSLVLQVWYAKIHKKCHLLPSLFRVSFWDKKVPETWMKFGGWEQYITSCTDIDNFVWLVAIFLKSKFENLINEVKSLADTYGIMIEDNFSDDTEDSNMFVIKPKPVSGKPKEVSFSEIIQYSDKDKLLKRFHELIDGRGGSDVGCVFLRALQENLITRLPTQKEYESEFERNGSWSAIHNYMSDKNLNALDRANRIVFFS